MFKASIDHMKPCESAALTVIATHRYLSSRSIHLPLQQSQTPFLRMTTPKVPPNIAKNASPLLFHPFHTPPNLVNLPLNLLDLFLRLVSPFSIWRVSLPPHVVLLLRFPGLNLLAEFVPKILGESVGEVLHSFGSFETLSHVLWAGSGGTDAVELQLLHIADSHGCLLLV